MNRFTKNIKKIKSDLNQTIKTTLIKLKEIKINKFIYNKRYQLILVLTAPLITFGLYFYVIGRDRYFTRSDVVVRSASGSTNSSAMNILFGTGNKGSLEDARFLRTYLESPQVLEKLEKEINFLEVYSKKGLDIHAGIRGEASKEKKYDFFRRQISITLNESSGILRIRTLAFDPDTSIKFNLFLIDQAEKFINELNQDVFKQQLKFAKKEVQFHFENLKKTSKDLSDYQREYTVIDAQSEAIATGEYIGALEKRLVDLKIELAKLKRSFVNPEDPEILDIKNEIKELKLQISLEKDLTVSPQGKNLNQKIASITELETALQFASDLYKSALITAERTRVDSLQQQRFMAILSMPQKPEDPWQYWRHKGFLTAISVLIVSFLLIKFLIGMSDSHRN